VRERERERERGEMEKEKRGKGNPLDPEHNPRLRNSPFTISV
jgi:hypothetical protein